MPPSWPGTASRSRSGPRPVRCRTLERLKNDEAQVGFVQGGVIEPKGDPDEEDTDSRLLSLGSVFFEPVWVFYRGDHATGASIV